MDVNNMNSGTSNDQTTIPPNAPGGYATSTQGGQPQSGKKIDLPVDPKFLAAVAVAAVLFLILVIPAIAKTAEESKVKKAIKTYVEVFVTGDTDPEDVKWRKYYPKDVEDDFTDWASERYDYLDDNKGFEKRFDYKIMSITGLKGDQNIEIYENTIKNFFDARECRIRSKNLKISKCYLVWLRDDSERDSVMRAVLVAKVNGSYGVYTFFY